MLAMLAKARLVIFVVAAGLTSLGTLVTEMGRAGRFAQDSERAVATVLEVWREETRGRRGGISHNYYMSVSFQTAAGRDIKVDRTRVDASAFREHRRGDQVPITYRRGDPRELYLGHGEYPLGHIPILLGACVLCFGFLLWRFRGLIGWGVAAAGRAAATGDEKTSTASPEHDRRMNEAIARAAGRQARAPAFAPMPTVGPMQSRGFCGAATSDAPRAAFGRRRSA